MAVRRIQMFLETWDRTNLQEQENTFGRYKESGAPFGKKNEFDEVDLDLLPVDAHVRLAKEVDKPILIQMVLMKQRVNLIQASFLSLSKRILTALSRCRPILEHRIR